MGWLWRRGQAAAGASLVTWFQVVKREAFSWRLSAETEGSYMDAYDSQNLVDRFGADGFVFLPELLPTDMLNELRASVPAVLKEIGPQRYLERDGMTARTVYGLHDRDGVWRAVSESSVLARIARELLREDIYVFQWKISPKTPGVGDQFEWHRDFSYWSSGDGMPAPRALTAAVFLDDIGEDNGPLQVIPASHRLPPLPEERNVSELAQQQTSSSLPYTVSEDSIDGLRCDHGVFNACGPPGSVIFFDCNLIHGSGSNSSHRPRTLALITYNPVSNAPRNWPNPRPDCFVNHYPRALQFKTTWRP